LDDARRSYEDGFSAFEQHKFADAESAFKQSYAQKPFPITAYFLSCLYAQSGRRSQAGGYAEKALHGIPELDRAYAEGARRILAWSKKTSAELDTDAKLDTPPPKFPIPTEKSLPGEEADAASPAATSNAREVIKGSGAAVFLVVGGQRRWIPNQQTFESLGLDWPSVKTIGDQQLNDIPKGEDYPSLNRRAVKGSGSEIYLLEGGKKRWIPNEQKFAALKLRMEDVETISDEDLSFIPLGSPIPE